MYALISGLCGRISAGFPAGKYKTYRTIIKVCHGFIFFPLFTLGWWGLLLPLFWFGEKPGCGHPYGWIERGTEEGDPEWYEIGFIKKNPWYGVFVRGLIYPLPLLPLVLIDWKVGLLIPVYGFSNVLSFIIGKRLPKFKLLEIDGAWTWSDFLRHFIAYITIMTI